VVTSLCLLLLRQIRQFSVTDQPGRNELPRWLCTPRCRSALQWLFHTGRLWLRQFYRKGTLTHEAWTAAESFMADIDALESRWSMDPTIVMLVVSQLLVATAIGYATAVEVTIDGFVTFLLCAGFGALVIVYAKRSGWTLSAPLLPPLPNHKPADRCCLDGRYSAAVSRAAWPWFIPLTLRFSAETLSANEQLLGAYLKLAMTILLPAQLLLFPACAPPPSIFLLSVFFWSPFSCCRGLASRCCIV